MKKVLVITYYWPPSGGGGVQRWLKFVKYFRDQGWEPVVYTPLNPEMPSEDVSLLAEIPDGIEVVKTKIWEPYLLYKRFIGKKKTQRINTGFLSDSKKPKTTENIAVWLRGNFFIPDARKFWIKPSIKFLKSYLKEHPVDAMVSTGPPHSMHMIALGIKKSLDIPWIADFRDPWTNIDFYHKLRLTKRGDRVHHQQEKQVIDHADVLTTVSWSWAEDFKQLGAKNVQVITNGFDPADYVDLAKTATLKFELCHIGSMNKDRNPGKFWEALSLVAKKVEGFKDQLHIVLLGSTDHQVFEDLKRFGLMDQVEHFSYLPHKEVLERASKASVLLLPLNDTPNVSGIIPGKIFEYLALQKPILAIGPDTGDSARILRETNCGEIAGFDEVEKMAQLIVDHYQNYLNPNNQKVKTGSIADYSRRELTKKMSSLLDSFQNQG